MKVRTSTIGLDRRALKEVAQLQQHFSDMEKGRIASVEHPIPRNAATIKPSVVHGVVATGFEPVEAAFQENFQRHGEVGAALSVFLDGTPVVDLWGGRRTKTGRLQWQESTLVPLRTVGSSLLAMCCALAHSRGWLRYDKPVAEFWPEFGLARKAGITVRQLLSHQAGLSAPDFEIGELPGKISLDEALAQQKPNWKPGAYYGFHAASFDLYVGELIRRCDPLGRNVADFFAQEISLPLNADVHIHEDPTRHRGNVAVVAPGSIFQRIDLLETLGPEYLLARAWPKSLASRSMSFAADEPASILGTVCLPSQRGVGTARGIAALYSAFSSNDGPLGMAAPTLDELQKPPVAPSMGTKDRILKRDLSFSLGFWKSHPKAAIWPNASSYGAPIFGGGVAFASPNARLAFCYLPNRQGPHLLDDSRCTNLISGVHRCLDAV